MLKKILFVYILASSMIVYSKTANTAPYDTSRLIQLMKKAARGESISIAALGGSITKGYNASTEEKRWANQMAAWWKTTFPNTPVNLINAGIGGTGTDIAVHRVKQDVLVHKPDLIVVEFSVNDSKGDYAVTMMEGLVRQILSDPSKPALMILMLKQDDGTTAQESHKIVGNYYKVPMISFADQIDEQVKKDGVELKSLFCDGLHPVDIGMTYIASFIKDEFNEVLAKAEKTPNIPLVTTVLPKPVKGNVYDRTERYDNSTIEPIQNKGWKKDEKGWSANEVGAELVFSLDGNAISLLYSKHNDISLGQAEIWVDNEKPVLLDAYWTETWGPAIKFAMAAENLQDGIHKLHIRVVGTNSKGSVGHVFKILNIQKAGNIK